MNCIKMNLLMYLLTIIDTKKITCQKKINFLEKIPRLIREGLQSLSRKIILNGSY